MGRANWKLVPCFLFPAHRANNRGYFMPEMYKTTQMVHNGKDFIPIKVQPYHIGRTIMDFVQTKKVATCPAKIAKKGASKGHKKVQRSRGASPGRPTPAIKEQ
eukprot:EG_transcript_39017